MERFPPEDGTRRECLWMEVPPNLICGKFTTLMREIREPGFFTPQLTIWEPDWPLYRVSHHLVDLGWVDFDFAYSTVYLILLVQTRDWQNWLSSWASGWNIQMKANPTQVRKLMVQPVEVHLLCTFVSLLNFRDTVWRTSYVSGPTITSRSSPSGGASLKSFGVALRSPVSSWRLWV